MEAATAMVSRLVLVAGLAAKEAVTPGGSGDVPRVTLSANPPSVLTVIVAVPELPGEMEKLLTDEVN